MVISGPPQSPRTGLALTDLQQSTSGDSSIDLNNLNNNNNNLNNNGNNGSSSSFSSISGGLISGLTIATNGSGNWSTRGVGGIGAGLSCSSVSSVSHQSSFGGLFGGGSFGQIQGGGNGNGGGGLFNNCGCSSSDYGLFKK